MDTIRSLSLSALAFSVLSTLGLAQPPPPAPFPPPGPGAMRNADHPVGASETVRRFRVAREALPPGEKESATFLGVETMPVSPTLTAQLGLPKGAGLVVGHIVPDSPAAAALQPHDILLKMDDQLLIEPRQFSVLVRNHSEGDEVTLTYVRAGKQATAKVKLTKHDLPKMTFLMDDGNVGFRVADARPIAPGAREEMGHVLALMDGEPRAGVHSIHGATTTLSPGFRAMQIHPGNSNMVYSDEKGALDLTIKDGVKTLVAKNTKGEQVFSGPVTTPEERKALPADLRERLEQLEGMQGFSFKADDQFFDHVKTYGPDRMRIVLPLPEDADERATLPSSVL